MAEGGQRYVPSDDVLHMAVLDIHLGGPRNWNAAGAVPHGHDEVRVYQSLAPLSSGEEEKEEAEGEGGSRTRRLLNPHGLRANQLRHAVDVGEIELALIRAVVGREHVLLPRRAQQALHGDFPARQRLGRPALVLLTLLRDPPARHQHLRRIPGPLQRRHHLEPVLAVAHSRPNQHLLVVPEPPRC